MNKEFTIWFENELIIINPTTGAPIYQKDWIWISTSIIEEISRIHPVLVEKLMIKKELDACQIEIVNNWWKKTINEAIDEMMTLFEITAETAKSLWYMISPSVVPSQNFTTISSGWKDHYEDIIKILRDAWVEKSTNIAGLHCNIGSQDKDKILNLHYNLSLKVLQNLQKEALDTLLISKERFNHYLNVVKVMKLDYLPKVPHENYELDKFYLDENWIPKSSYEFVRLKRLLESGIYISELRTPDAGTSLKSLENNMKNAYNFIFES